MTYYSPHTGEHIDTQTPADWMSATTLPVPAYDPANQGAFFRDGTWVVETAQPPAALVPQSVTRFQALAALHLAGHLPAVQAIMAAPETPALAKLAWDNALSFERSSPTLASLAGALGLTDDALDALFVAAAGVAA